MPKEVIVDSQAVELHTFAVQVTWGKEGTVEVASINLEKEQYTPERGWFVYLERDALNRLIRVLRKARDQAYGTDE